jgi:hypothetical protein
MLCGLSNPEELDRRSMWNAWGREQMHKGLWWGNLRVREHLEELGVEGRIILK